MSDHRHTVGAYHAFNHKIGPTHHGLGLWWKCKNHMRKSPVFPPCPLPHDSWTSLKLFPAFWPQRPQSAASVLRGASEQLGRKSVQTNQVIFISEISELLWKKEHERQNFMRRKRICSTKRFRYEGLGFNPMCETNSGGNVWGKTSTCVWSQLILKLTSVVTFQYVMVVLSQRTAKKTSEMCCWRGCR